MIEFARWPSNGIPNNEHKECSSSGTRRASHDTEQQEMGFCASLCMSISVIVLGNYSYQSLGKDSQLSDPIVHRMNNRPLGLVGNINQ